MGQRLCCSARDLPPNLVTLRLDSPFCAQRPRFCRGKVVGEVIVAHQRNSNFQTDKKITYSTREDQALTYRLSGDRNPLHSDPSFAALGGFDKPILHGLCTYGMTGRALLHGLCEGDASRFLSMNARFSKPVIPGDSLTVCMWVDGQKALFRTENQNNEVVIDQGEFSFS